MDKLQDRHIIGLIQSDPERGFRMLINRYKESAALFTEAYCNFQKEICFAQSRKILELREKYYGIYSGFLTQKQILQVFEAEREMMDRLAGRGRGRGPEGPEGPDHGHRQGPARGFPQNFVILRPDKLYGYAEHRLL